MRPAVAVVATVALAAVVAGCGIGGRKSRDSSVGYREKGIASWYGPGFHGKRTANGEIYDMHAMTAAHKSLPFDLIVEVRNLDNGRRARVRINDRGPFVRGRIIDLSRAGAAAIGVVGAGTARVAIEVVEGPRPIERHGSYWVQIASFRERGNAESLERRVRRDFPGVRLRSEDGWHRVGFGPFSKKSEADDLVRRLERRGHDALVIGAQ